MKFKLPNSIILSRIFGINTFILLVVIGILVLTIRGNPGSPGIKELFSQYWMFDGPLELSPDRGRFALLYSLAEDHSFQFSLDVAKFAIPDLGYYNGKFVSLFAPGMSFIALPGYYIGKYFGLSQVGAFSVISFFAILNFLLIRAISSAMGVSKPISNISAIVFLFASNAFSYGVSFYQHHISTFLILISIYALLKLRTVYALMIVWVMCVIGIMVDYPNFFLMFPIGLIAFLKIISVKKTESKLILNLNIKRLLTIIVCLIPLALFAKINLESYGSPTALAGTVTQVRTIDIETLQEGHEDVLNDPSVNITDKTADDRSAVGFFETRNMLQGLAILIISPDRGFLMYTPIMVLGIIGLLILYKKKSGLANLFLAIISVDILLYSMWGDPWGGWAFGPRYLIPCFAILSILVGVAFERFKKNILFLIVFIVLFCYSAFVSTVGALTTNALPPKVEVLALEELSGTVQKYTYERNMDHLNANNTKSYIYNTYMSEKLNAWQYFSIIYSAIIVIMFVSILLTVINRKIPNEYNN